MNNTPSTDDISTDGKDLLPEAEHSSETAAGTTPAPEFGGRRDGLEPTRYGDWEKSGRCIDF